MQIDGTQQRVQYRPTHGQPIFNKCTKAVQQRVIFSTNSLRTIGGPLAQKQKQNKKKEPESYLAPYAKLNSKWIVDLNVKPQKEIGENHLGLGLGGEFLETTSKAQFLRGNT